jgi:hypothetical protein
VVRASTRKKEEASDAGDSTDLFRAAPPALNCCIWLRRHRRPSSGSAAGSRRANSRRLKSRARAPPPASLLLARKSMPPFTSSICILSKFHHRRRHHRPPQPPPAPEWRRPHRRPPGKPQRLRTLAVHPLYLHSSSGRVPTVPPAGGHRGCAEAGEDRVEREETRPWMRERGDEREKAYIFLTKSRSRFYCGRNGTFTTRTW